MLSLTRKTGESIVIGDDIEVVLLSAHGEQARIGIVAPREIPVNRKEIYEMIQLENLESTRDFNLAAWQEWRKTRQ
jgi:carbon storage regulator